MKNPVPKNGMFVTPKTLAELMNIVDQGSPEERRAGIMAAQFALNWAHQQVAFQMQKTVDKALD